MEKIVLDAGIMLIMDILWLYYFMGPRYSIMINSIQGSDIKLNFKSAIMAYICMIIGYYWFVTDKISALVLGLVIYGVYDFTCGAVFTKWDFNLAIIDIIWGGFLFYSTNIIGENLNMFIN